MGLEFKGKGVNVALGPMMNMGRVAGVSTGCLFVVWGVCLRVCVCAGR